MVETGHDNAANASAGATMTDDYITLSMAIPVDSDGFLRRECPTCEREFKWLPAAEDDDAVSMPDGGYFCPYCGVQAPAGAWFTKAQAALAGKIAEAEVVEPMLSKFADDIARSFQRAGMTTRSAPRRQADEPEPLTEADDMTRVDFACHPSEPLKILDDWHEPVRCLICGKLTS
jgi:hypothetical protein